MNEFTPPEEYQEADEMLIVALESGWDKIELYDDTSDEVEAKVNHHHL